MKHIFFLCLSIMTLSAYAEDPAPNEAEKKRDLFRRCARSSGAFDIFGECPKLPPDQTAFVSELKEVYVEAEKPTLPLLGNTEAWKSPEATATWSKYEEQKTEGDIALFKKHCGEKFDASNPYCMSEEEIKKMRFEKELNICRNKRIHQFMNSPKSGDVDEPSRLWERHEKEYPALKSGETCETLLERDKKTYGIVVEEKPKVVIQPVVQTVEPVVSEEATEEEEKNPRNYIPNTCDWVKDLPRRVVNGPGEAGCTEKSNAMFCVGYVVCDRKEGGGKFVRLSTCGPENCGGKQKDAVKCTKQKTHFSYKPKDETREYVSPKVKSGAVKQ